MPGILVEVQKVGTLGEEREGDARESSIWDSRRVSGPCSCRAGVLGRSLDKAARSRLRQSPRALLDSVRTCSPISTKVRKNRLRVLERENSGEGRVEKYLLSLSYAGESLLLKGMGDGGHLGTLNVRVLEKVVWTPPAWTVSGWRAETILSQNEEWENLPREKQG